MKWSHLYLSAIAIVETILKFYAENTPNTQAGSHALNQKVTSGAPVLQHNWIRNSYPPLLTTRGELVARPLLSSFYDSNFTSFT